MARMLWAGTARRRRCWVGTWNVGARLSPCWTSTPRNARPGSSTTTPPHSRGSRAGVTVGGGYQCGETTQRRRSSKESSLYCQPPEESTDEKFGINGGDADGEDGDDEVGRMEPR